MPSPPTRTLLASLVAVLTAVGAARATTTAGRTLDRLHDPVVVRTGLLGGGARDTAGWRLYAVHEGACRPIPFQFDARADDGEVVLSDAPFAFDDDDELVFMAKDTGDRATPAALPDGADRILEIEVTDATGAGWAYLVHFPRDPPPPSPVRYTGLAGEPAEMRAPFYAVAYDEGSGNFVQGLRVAHQAGGSGERLIERTRLRLAPTFSLMVTDWTPTYTEDSFSVTPEGMRNGPVRTVRRIREALHLGRFLPDIPQGTVSTFYYFSSVRTPSRFSLPSLALRALRAFRFESVHDFGAQAAGMRYFDAANPQGVPLAAAARPSAPDRDRSWWVVDGPGGTFLHWLDIPPAWREWGVARGTVVGAAAGGVGAGFTLRGMEQVREPGEYPLESALVVLPRAYRPGDERPALAMLDEPLAVHVRPLTDEPTHAALEDRAPPAP